MYQEILAKIITVDDLETMLTELEELERSLYENKGDGLSYVLKNKVRFWLSELMIEEVGRSNLDWQSYIAGLKERVKLLEKFSLTLAFEPSRGFLTRVHRFVCEAAGRHLIINLAYDPTLIGGVVMSFQGRFKDFSFKKIFEEEFNSGKKKFLEIIKTSNLS